MNEFRETRENEVITSDSLRETITSEDYVEMHNPMPECDEEPTPYPVEYQFTLTPPTEVMVNSEAFIKCVVIPPLGHIYVDPVVSQATEVTYWYGASYRAPLLKKADGTQQVWVNTPLPANAYFAVRLHSLPIGTHNIEVTIKTGGIKQTQSCLVKVSYMKATHPRYKKWLDTMIKVAPKWADPKKVFGFGYEGDVWYYDGAKVYFQVSDYLNEPKYIDTAFNIARQYRDYSLNAANGIPGWRVFTRGLRMAYERSGDETYRKAVFHHANTMYASFGGSPQDSIIRENAYAINAHVDAEYLGMPRTTGNLSRCIENMLNVFDLLFSGSKLYTLHQTFFDGLAMESLINYYEMSGDRRMIAAVQQCCEWMMANAITEDGKLIINPEPKGPKCDWGCQWPNTDQINLTVAAFPWLWSVTGDVRYKNAGDNLFLHSLDTDISYSGKIFSQNYKSSFSFLKYRGNSE